MNDILLQDKKGGLMLETELVFQSKAIGVIYLGSKNEFNTIVESILKSQDEDSELVKVSGNYIAVSDGRELMTYSLTEDMYGTRFLYISGDDSLSGRTFHSAIISFIISDNGHKRTLSFLNNDNFSMPEDAESIINSIINGLKKSVKVPDADAKVDSNISNEEDEDEDEWI